MPSIVIRLDPTLLTDPNLDLRYAIPDKLEERTGGLVKDGGYDYEFGPDDQISGQEAMQIYLETDDLETAFPAVVAFLETSHLFGNDLAAAATMGVAEEAAGEATTYSIRYPPGRDGVISVPNAGRQGKA